MKRELLVFLALCALAIAMVPRERRGVKPEEQGKSNVELCSKDTSCGWGRYRLSARSPPMLVFTTNKKCICAVGMECLESEYTSPTDTYIYRCQAPGQKKSHN